MIPENEAEELRTLIGNYLKKIEQRNQEIGVWEGEKLKSQDEINEAAKSLELNRQERTKLKGMEIVSLSEYFKIVDIIQIEESSIEKFQVRLIGILAKLRELREEIERMKAHIDGVQRRLDEEAQVIQFTRKT